jgi:hypothetical protein
MQRTYHLLTLLLLAQLGFGQDWRPLHPARTAYYKKFAGTFSEDRASIRWTRAAARADGADSIWYPELLHYALHELEYCMAATPDPSPFGDSIRVFANGDMDFYYPDGDTLHLPKHPGSPWVMLRTHGRTYPAQIIATPTGYQLDNILGQSDSVLVLELAFLDSLGDTVTRTSRLSKHFGWLDPILRYRIDAFDSASTYNAWGMPELLGITAPNFGIRKVAKEEFFTMQPGDTIQTYKHFGDEHSNRDHHAWQQDIYLARNMSPTGDTIFFVIDRTVKVIDNPNQVIPPPFRGVVIDTIPLQSPQYRRLDRDLGEIYTSELQASAWVPVWRVHPQYGFLMKPMAPKSIVDTINACYPLWLDFPASGEYSEWDLDMYMEGLGGPYWHKTFFVPGEPSFYRDVTYYHTHNGQGGTWMDFDSILTVVPEPSLEQPGSASLRISPNPNGGEFRLHLPQALANKAMQISVVATDGHECLRVTTQAPAYVDLDARSLSPGLYLLRVQARDRLWVEKLLIR